VDTVHVFPTLFGAMHHINEVAVEKVRQHGAPTLSPRYHFLLRTVRGFFLSFFLSFSLFFSLFDDTVFLFVFSVYIGTIKLFALISTCNRLVMLEKVKVVPHL
jgi:hypothetical protein